MSCLADLAHGKDAGTVCKHRENGDEGLPWKLRAFSTWKFWHVRKMKDGLGCSEGFCEVCKEKNEDEGKVNRKEGKPTRQKSASDSASPPLPLKLLPTLHLSSLKLIINLISSPSTS